MISDEFYTISISGDTMINSTVYHKLEIPFVFDIGNCPNTIPGYKGAIRQDTLARKVFFVTPNDTTEQLLFDFNMQVGDTVQGYTEDSAFGKDTVQAIDSILIGNSYRKRWLLSPGANYYIQLIEGIGSTYAMMAQSWSYASNAPDYYLGCFSQNGITLYPDSTSNCQVIVGVISDYSKNISIVLFPNPFTNEFTIQTNTSELSEIIIRDISSRNILRQKFTNSVSLNTDQLARGLYIYEVRSKDGSCMKGKITKN